jgi:putative serine protease PepD
VSDVTRPRSQLIAAVVLSACVGLLGGALAAWGIYARFGPVERVVTQTTNVTGPNSGTDVATIAKQASGSVVEIATHPVDSQSLLSGAPGLTDGFVVSSDGLIVTSIHAVHGATALSVSTSDGHVFPATIVRADPSHGIVVLRAVNAQSLSPLTFASQAPRPGDLSVVVARAPFNPLILTTGVVSSTGRTVSLADGEPVLSDVVTVDATPDPIQDGAPLLSGSGAVTGVVVDAGSSSSGVVALSGRSAADLVEEITSGGTANTPSLGVASIVVDAATAAAAGMPVGALVRSVVNGGAAALAGIVPGDVVTVVNGVSIDATHPFDAVSLGLTAFQQVSVALWRSGATLSVTVTVGTVGPSTG